MDEQEKKNVSLIWRSMMGKNIYETPRNHAKWHTQGKDKVADTFSAQSGDDKTAKLQMLKARLEKNKKTKA